MNIFQLILI